MTKKRPLRHAFFINSNGIIIQEVKIKNSLFSIVIIIIIIIIIVMVNHYQFSGIIPV